ncbi:DegT/DnrJ/EryC1/StrS family aminotransferase [Thermodesulfobacteriota bacterium]
MKKEIPWFLPSIGKRDYELVEQVLDSNYINDGEVTRQFERRIAELIGARHCVAVTSGTAAITLALMAAGIGKGHEVLVPDLTFIATANAVHLSGASVRLVDIDAETFTIEPTKIEEAIGPLTRAVVTVDVNGRGADYKTIDTICQQNNLVLVCDSAEALGSKHGDKYLGTFGEAGCFSFSPNKTITCGQGGMVATDSVDIYHNLLELKDQGRRKQGTGGDDLHPVIGFNFKLTNLQAAIGLAQLESLEQRLEAFIKRDNHYTNRLKDCHGLYIPEWDPDSGQIKQWMDILVEQRQSVCQALKNAGIGNRAFWFPLHTQKPYSSDNARFRNSVDISAKGLWLPSYFDLTTDEIDRTCDIILATLAKI